MASARRIGRLKAAAGLSRRQSGRWREVLVTRLAAAERLGLASSFTRALYALIHRESLRIQKGAVGGR
jgi:chorismate mutase